VDVTSIEVFARFERAKKGTGRDFMTRIGGDARERRNANRRARENGERRTREAIAERAFDALARWEIFVYQRSSVDSFGAGDGEGEDWGRWSLRALGAPTTRDAPEARASFIDAPSRVPRRLCTFRARIG